VDADAPDRRTRLEKKLKAEFGPSYLEIVDESHRHAGHQEQFDGSGETHLRVRITAAAFEGMGRVARHRAVNEAAASEFAQGLHALAIEAAAPSEISR
jgi:BolA family transcriptional regulator, general stress-responsive regulator